MSGIAEASVKAAVVNQRICKSEGCKVNSCWCYFSSMHSSLKKALISPFLHCRHDSVIFRATCDPGNARENSILITKSFDFSPPISSKTSGWSLWCTSTLSQTIGSVSLPKRRKLEEQETVVSFFSKCFFFMAKWCHQMFVCAKSKIILLFSIFLKHKFDAKLPWLHTKKWSLLELSSERFGAILPRFGALFKTI